MMPSVTQLIIVGVLAILLFKSKDLPRIATDVSDALKAWKSGSKDVSDTLLEEKR